MYSINGLPFWSAPAEMLTWNWPKNVLLNYAIGLIIRDDKVIMTEILLTNEMDLVEILVVCIWGGSLIFCNIKYF